MPAISKPSGTLEAARSHSPEYGMEAASLGMFMVSACLFGVLLQNVAGLAGRVLGGVAMGLTAVSIISSPWGQRSGAHMNPALTLAFLSLGKIAPWDAFFYVVAQFAAASRESWSLRYSSVRHWRESNSCQPSLAPEDRG